MSIPQAGGQGGGESGLQGGQEQDRPRLVQVKVAVETRCKAVLCSGVLCCLGIGCAVLCSDVQCYAELFSYADPILGT